MLSVYFLELTNDILNHLLFFFTGTSHTNNYQGFFNEPFNTEPMQSYINIKKDYIIGEAFEDLWIDYLT